MKNKIVCLFFITEISLRAKNNEISRLDASLSRGTITIQPLYYVADIQHRRDMIYRREEGDRFKDEEKEEESLFHNSRGHFFVRLPYLFIFAIERMSGNQE